MPFRVEVNNNTFQLVDNATNEVLEQPNPANGTKYRYGLAAESVRFYKERGAPLYRDFNSLGGNEAREFVVTDLLDSNGAAWTDFSTLISFLDANIMGFNPAAASLPAGSIDFQTAKIINSVSEFETNGAGEYVFENETPGTSMVFWIDTTFLDLVGNSFRITDQTIVLYNPSPGIAVIFDDDGIDMFVGSGSVFLINVVIVSTGVGASVFSGLVASAARRTIFTDGVTFDSCVTLGTIPSTDRIILRNSQMELCQNGVTFDGANVRGTLVQNFECFQCSGTMFAGTGTYSTDQAYFLNVKTELNAGSTIYDFVPANFTIDAAFQIKNNFNVNANPTFVNGILKGDPASLWSGNNGFNVENTEPGFTAVQNANSTTVIGMSTDWFIMTTSYTIVDSDYFSVSGGQFQYDAQTQRKIFLQPVLSIQGGVNQQYEVGFAINGTGTIIGQLRITTSLGIGGNTSENLAPNFPFNVTSGDTIELAIRKVVDTNTNPILLQNSTFVTTFATS